LDDANEKVEKGQHTHGFWCAGMLPSKNIPDQTMQGTRLTISSIWANILAVVKAWSAGPVRIVRGDDKFDNRLHSAKQGVSVENLSYAPKARRTNVVASWLKC
jgi:hypothetical protein